MATRIPDLRSLQLLISVAESGSLAGAASVHGISQPSASVRISALERQLGLCLLVRDNRGSRLTPEGRLVVSWAGTVISSAEHLIEGVNLLRKRREPGLTVAASLTVAEYLMPDLLTRLHRTLPAAGVQLRVANSEEVIALVRTKRVPLGFVESTGVPPDLASSVIGTDTLVVVVAPSHAWARRSLGISISELLDTPLLLREKGSGARETLESRLSRHGHLAAPALQLSTNSSIRGAALAGGAPAVLSKLTIGADLAGGQLIEVPVDGLSLNRRLRAVWPRDRVPSGEAQTLLVLARKLRKAEGG